MTAPRLSFHLLAPVVAAFGWALDATAQTSAPLPSSTAPIAPTSTGAPQAPVPAKTATPNTPSTAPAPTAQPATTALPPATDPKSPAPAAVTAPVTPKPAAPTGTGEPAATPSEPAAPATNETAAPTPPPYPRVEDGPKPPVAPAEPKVHEPPLPEAYRTGNTGAPIPPPEPQHVAPRASLWAGVRPTLLLPLGSIWTDREPQNEYCCSQNPRPFSEFATTGPGLGLDIGARFGRNYQAFAFGEYSFLGAGPLENEFGGQESVRTSIIGVGVRFSTHPDSLGFLIEMSLGYRKFEAKWKDGTTLSANDDLFSTRLGVGGVWQINRMTSVELLVMLGGGAFTDVKWTFANGDDSSALSGYDDRGQYIPLGFQLGVHWDIISTKD